MRTKVALPWLDVIANKLEMRREIVATISLLRTTCMAIAHIECRLQRRCSLMLLVSGLHEVMQRRHLRRRDFRTLDHAAPVFLEC